jgi:hypothetical protein
MTDTFIYSPAGYRNMIKMSAFKYILVEGRDDKISLTYLIQDLLGKHSDIKVHGAHQIRFGNDIGNRERVEAICESLKDESSAKRFVGFVDREFREFDLNENINDLINKHNIIGCLIWSRGHSIENYYFDFTILERVLRLYSVTEYFDEAIILFEQNLQSILKLACAISLAAYEHKILKPVRSSIDWKILDFNASILDINTANWSKTLIKKQKIRNEDTDALIGAFQAWFEKVSKADYEIVRWLCHGHIGLTFIWAAYARCVFEVCERAKSVDPWREANKVLKAEETVRFNGCASEWARQAVNKLCEYPTSIFEHLWLTIH